MRAQGDASKRVVFMMVGQMKKGGSWPPAASEGFVSVMDCHNDADAAAAVRAWAVYGRDDGCEATAAAEAEGLATATAAAVAATRGSDKAQQGAQSEAATLAVWREHVAKRKPAHTGIMSFFKQAAPAGKGAAAAAAGTGVGTAAAAAGAAASPLSAAKAATAPKGSRPQSGPTAAAPSPGGSGTRGRQGTGQADKGAVEAPAAAKGPGRSAASAGPARRPMDELPADEPGAKRRTLAAPKVGSGSAIGSNSGEGGEIRTAVAGEAGTRTTPHGESTGEGGRQSSPVRTGKPGSGQTGRNAFAVLMASAAQSHAGVNGGGTGGKRAGGALAVARWTSRRAIAAVRFAIALGVIDFCGAAGEDVDPRFKLSSPWAQALRNTALHPEKAQQQILHKDDEVRQQ
jgi:hypothetical protein